MTNIFLPMENILLKKILLLTFIIVLNSSFIVTNAAVQNSISTTGTVLFSNHFDKHQYNVKLTSYDLQQIKHYKLSHSNIMSMPKPTDWMLQYWTFRPDTSLFLNKNKEFGIRSRSKVVMYSNQIFRASNKAYQIILDVECPAGSKHKSIIGTGFCLYGLYENGISFRDVKSFVLHPGQHKTFVVPASFSKWNSKFRLGIYAQGTVIIKKVELREIPDKIVPDMVDLAETTFLTGWIKARSELPDPKNSSYPDCRFTVHFKGNNILKGKACPEEIQLTLDGFLGYKLLKSASLKEGDFISCVIVPFSKLPLSMQTTQQADDLELFSLDNYFVLSLEKISPPASNIFSKIPFSGTSAHTSIFELNFNPPLSQDLRLKQSEAIAEDMKQMQALLMPYTEEERNILKKRFSSVWLQEKEKDHAGFNRLVCKNVKLVWRNVGGSFWALPENWALYTDYTPVDKTNLQAIIDFQKFLNHNGIQLIVCPTPSHYDIAARVMNPEFRNIPDFRTADLVQHLLKNGIEAIYVSDEIIKNYNRYPFAFFIHNFHPADTAQDVIADMIVKKLKRYHFPENMSRTQFSIKPHSHVYDDYGQGKDFLFPTNCDIGNNKAGTSFLCRQVLYRNQEILPDKKSPVLFMGNSMLQTPMRSPASLPTLCALKLSMGTDLLLGSGWSTHTVTLQSLVNTPEFYLKEKKVVVLVVSTFHFYSKVKFYNVRELDQIKAEISKRRLQFELEPKSNKAEIFPFVKNNQTAAFKNPKCIVMPSNGKYVILDTALSNMDQGKDIILLLKVLSSKPSSTSSIRINDKTTVEVPLDGINSKLFTIKLPAGTKNLKLEMISKDISEIVFDNIQVFQ